MNPFVSGTFEKGLLLTITAKYPDNFTCIDEKVHASRRRIVNNLYSMSSIVQAEGGIDVCIDMFMAQMGEFAESGQILDAAQWVQW